MNNDKRIPQLRLLIEQTEFEYNKAIQEGKVFANVKEIYLRLKNQKALLEILLKNKKELM